MFCVWVKISNSTFHTLEMLLEKHTMRLPVLLSTQESCCRTHRLPVPLQLVLHGAGGSVLFWQVMWLSARGGVQNANELRHLWKWQDPGLLALPWIWNWPHPCRQVVSSSTAAAVRVSARDDDDTNVSWHMNLPVSLACSIVDMRRIC